MISFASGNKDDNDAYLQRLCSHGARCALWGNELNRVRFCTDRSIGSGAHFVDGVYQGRTDPDYNWLGKPWEQQANAVFPGWFEVYRTAYAQTRYGYLLLNFTREYMKSKACRWEFGYLDHSRLYVYVHDEDRIVSWQDLADNEALMKKVLQVAAEDIAEKYGGDEQLQDRHCELPFRELLLERARAQKGLDSLEWATAAYNLGVVQTSLGHAAEAQQLLERALAIKERHS